MAAKPKMTDKEREELAAKLDKDLEDFMLEKANKPNKKNDFGDVENMTVDELAEVNIWTYSGHYDVLPDYLFIQLCISKLQNP